MYPSNPISKLSDYGDHTTVRQTINQIPKSIPQSICQTLWYMSTGLQFTTNPPYITSFTISNGRQYTTNPHLHCLLFTTKVSKQVVEDFPIYKP